MPTPIPDHYRRKIDQVEAAFRRSAGRPVADTEVEAIREWALKSLINHGLLESILSGWMGIRLRGGEPEFWDLDPRDGE